MARKVEAYSAAQYSSSPIAGRMLVQTMRHFGKASRDLRRVYTGIMVDYSSRNGINKGHEQVEGRLEKWYAVYGEDLIMPDTAWNGNYYGVSAVGEDYLAKRFRITKPEAVSAIKAMLEMPSMKGRVLLTNDEMPVGKFIIIDCSPLLADVDPLFNFKFRIPREGLPFNRNVVKYLVSDLSSV